MSTRAVDGPGGIPRAVTSGSTTAVAVVGLGLLLVSPISLFVAIATVYKVFRQVRRHWWEVAFGAVGVLAIVVLGLQLATGSALAFHFSGYAGVFSGDVSWITALAATMPIGIPLGVLAGSCYVGASERWAAGAEWHPVEQRRQRVEKGATDRRVAAAVNDHRSAALCSAPPLGVLRDGDLETWTEGGYVVIPPGQFPAMGLVGESGSGKTVTAERLVSLWARSGRKVVFADFKGSDPELATRIVAAYRHERPDALCGLWPAQPLDMWRGSPTEIVNRLMAVHEFTEPYYKDSMRAAISLAMLAPDIDGRGPVRDSQSFMDRLDASFLRSAWEGRREARQVESLVRDPKALAGVLMRFSSFFSALAGRLDHGFSFEDADLTILTVPTLAAADDAMAIAKMVLADFASYLFARKPRIGEDVTLMVDEFSAVTAAAPLVTTLAERVRDVGGQVVVSVQSWEGLGRDDGERRRMRDALAPGGLVVHRLGDPEEFIKAAGSVRAVERSWQLDEDGATGLGTSKMGYRYRIEPDAVRQAKTGEAWIITGGRAAHLSVLRTRIAADERERAEALVGAAWRQAADDLAAGRYATEADWWEVRGELASPRAELEDGDLFALPPGDDPPPMLEPGPPPQPVIDPRIVLAIAAYVRANLIRQALEIAREARVKDPRAYVDAERAKRQRAIEAAQKRRPA